MGNDEFTPKLGKIGKDGRRAQRYFNKVVAAAARAGPALGKASRRFDGSRIGRGASMGRLLGSAGKDLARRRAVVKARLVRLNGRGGAAARAHLRYIERDSATRDGEAGKLYNRDCDAADGRAFLERSSEDRHQFRFIVSAEDGDQYTDLRPFTRRLMAQMEADLGTRLEWVAADHFDTGHPHTHIMLRGVDDKGKNLIIAREYLAHGLRARAAELVSLDLGPRTQAEIELRLRRDVSAERLTLIDRRLINALDQDHCVTGRAEAPFEQSLRTGRLRKLEALGLAQPLGDGRWRLDEALGQKLRALGERGDIIRALHDALRDGNLTRDLSPPDSLKAPVIGRVIKRGLSDEHRDRHFVVIDGIDGHAHYCDLGRAEAIEPLAPGEIVKLMPRVAELTPVDETIAQVARANNGRYAAALHLAHDPRARPAFIEAHERRLEALRRAGSKLERDEQGTWTIPTNHLERVTATLQRQVRERPVDIETLSTLSLPAMQSAEGATWLDDELVRGGAAQLRATGFGREVQAALAARSEWLVSRGFATLEGGKVQLRPTALAELSRHDLLDAARRLSAELGKPYEPTELGASVSGVIARRIDLASGRFALVERVHEFSLVPWRPILARHIGKYGAGIMRDEGISWRFGRERSSPTLS